MSGSIAKDYAVITAAVREALSKPSSCMVDARGYMAARAALLFVAAFKGRERAAELAYQIADELATPPERVA